MEHREEPDRPLALADQRIWRLYQQHHSPQKCPAALENQHFVSVHSDKIAPPAGSPHLHPKHLPGAKHLQPKDAEALGREKSWRDGNWKDEPIHIFRGEAWIWLLVFTGNAEK